MNNLNYTFTSKTKRITIGLMIIGLVSIIAGFLQDDPADHHHTRIWANLLVNSWFFMGIGLLATFFIALVYVTETACAIAVKRIFEALSSYLPVGAVIMILILLIS